MTGHVQSVVVGLDWSDAARAAVEHAAEAAARPTAAAAAGARARAAALPGAPRPGAACATSNSVLRKAGQRLLEETVDVLGLVYPDSR